MMEGEVNLLIERLARIEQAQVHQGKQLDRVVTLLDRMVRVEERQGQQQNEVRELEKRFERLQAEVGELRAEVERWETVRRVLVWLVGPSAVLGAIVAMVKK